MAVTLQPTRSLYAHVFGSRLWRDGNTEADSLGGAIVSSLLLSGLHRTPAELAARKQVEELNAGAALTFSRNALLAGLLVHHTQLSASLLRRPTPYNQFSFSGSTHTNASIFLNYSLKNTSFFSEVARSISGGYGLAAGMLSSLSHQVDVSIHVRSYSRNYQPFYANALSESTVPQNERGIYWGWKYTPSKKVVAAGYVDLFQFPWLRYRLYTPHSEGSEWLLRITYKPSKSINAYAQYREETKDRNVRGEAANYQVSAGTKRNVWLHADFRIGALNWKSRIQYSRYEHTTTTNGWAFIQEVTLPICTFSITARYVLFDTDDFDNRQYAYERDVWLAYSLPAYQGTGMRTYVLIHRALGPRLDAWLRWAHTSFRDRETIGTGTEKIDGNSRNDVKFQLRYRFAQ